MRPSNSYPYGLHCPECGSWYNGDPQYHVVWTVGETCGNQSFNPKRCNPKNPCQGKLVPVTKRDVERWERRERRRERRRQWEEAVSAALFENS